MELRDKYREIFSTPHGKDVLMDILDQSGVERSAFHPDPYIHAKRSGSQQMGFYIINQLKEKSDGSHGTSTSGTRTGGGSASNPDNGDTDPESKRIRDNTDSAGRYIP